MKKTLVSSLALMAIAASPMIASAASSSSSIGATYGEEISFASGSTIIDVGDSVDLRNFASSNSVEFILQSLNTDGSGKIEGVAWIRYLHGGGVTTTNITVDTNTVPPTTNTDVTTSEAGSAGFSDFIADITGKVGSKGSGDSAVSTVTLSIKGSGYTTGATNAPDLVAASDAKASKLTLTFKSTGGVATDITNEFTSVPGTLNGSVSTGFKTINNGKAISIKNETADLGVGTSTLTNLDLICVQIANKIAAASFFGNGSVSWKGSASSSKVSLSGKGVGSSHGASIKMVGSPGALSITNFFDETVVSVPNALATGITLTGKVNGQAVKATGGTAVGFAPGEF